MDAGSGWIRLSLDFAQREAGLELVADVSVFYMPADYVKKRAQAVYIITPGS